MPLEKLGKQILYICTVGALPGVSLWHVFTEARLATFWANFGLQSEDRWNIHAP